MVYLSKYFWLALLIFIPVIPRVSLTTVIEDTRGSAASDTALLLDDFIIFSLVALALGSLLARASVSGEFKLRLSNVGLCFAGFLLYKLIDFSILAYIFPWNFDGHMGFGIGVKEGVLVLGKSIAFLAVYLLMYMNLKDGKDLSVAVSLFIASVVVVVLVGFAQFFILDHPVLTSTFRNIDALGTINPNVWGSEDPWFGTSSVGHEHLGAFMILAQALIAGFLLCRWPRREMSRKALALMWFCCLFTLAFASSRGAWIGACFSFTALIWAAMKMGRLQQIFKGLFISAGVLLLFLAISDFSFTDYFHARVEGLMGVFSGKIEDDSALERFKLMELLWNRYAESPLIGWGAGSAGRIAEGQYLRELVEGGIVGLIWFLVLIAVCCKVALRLVRNSSDPFGRGLGVGFLGAVAGLCGQSFFTELFILTKVGTPFWCIAAIVHKASNLQLRDSYHPAGAAG